jgi:hypothetical protein
MDISRLIVGGNPFSGNSHISLDVDEAMEDYYSNEKIINTLFRCEECGVNTMQLRADKHIMRMIREFRLRGGTLNWIAQTASEMLSFDGNISQMLKYDPIAIYHHGTATDALFLEGRFDELKKRLDAIRRTGKAVGLGTHNPKVIEYAQEHHWDVDFYLASVYNLSRVKRVSSAVTGKSNEGEHFDDDDKPAMYRAIRAADKPCLAIKILAAGRKCGSRESVKSAFKDALTNIKETDAVIVGVFQKEKDQVYENAQIEKEILGC